MTLPEFIGLDIRDKSNLDSIFSYTDNYLNDLQTNKFIKTKVSIMDSIIEKYVDCGLNILYDSEDLTMLKKLCKDFQRYVLRKSSRSTISQFIPFVNGERDLSYLFSDRFNELYGLFISTYKSIIEKRRYHEFKGYFNPTNSTKDRIKFLVKKCISLIDEDSSLKPKAKKKFISEFETILRHLDSSASNWTVVLGKIKEITFILGALGGLATGAINVMNEFDDNESNSTKLNETVGLLYKMEDEIVGSYQITQDEFNDTFIFGNKLSMQTRSVEFKPLTLKAADDTPEKKSSHSDITDIEIINEEE